VLYLFPCSQHAVADPHVTDVNALPHFEAVTLDFNLFGSQSLVAQAITDENRQAQFHFGMKLYYGDGMQKDLLEAFRCFQKRMLS
jgi:TPR repeat protein